MSTHSVAFPAVPALATLQAGSNYVNVRQAGAAGDGKTDDTAAIQRAIDSLPKRKGEELQFGGTVFFPVGKYALIAPLTMGAGVSLLGEQAGSVVLLGTTAGCSPVLIVEGECACVDGITIDAPKIGVQWNAGSGSSGLNIHISRAQTAIALGSGAEGMLENLILNAAKIGIDAVKPNTVLVSSVGVSKATVAAVRLQGGGPLSVEGLQYDGAGPALDVSQGGRAALLASSATGCGEAPAVRCDASSLVYAGAISGEKRSVLIDDKSGNTTRIPGPSVSLYTGQATAFPS